MTATLEGILRPDGALPARQAVVPPASAWRRELEVARRLAWFPAAAAPAPYPAQPMPGLGRDADRHQCETPPAASVPMASCAPSASPGAVVAGGIGSTWQAVPSRIALVGVTRSPRVDGAAQSSPSLIAAVPPPASGRIDVAASLIALAVSSRTAPAPLAVAVQRTGTAPPPAPPEPARLPVRLHVEDTPQGMVVWLGMDGDSNGPALRAPTLVAELRRLLAASGQRLAGVICNGTPLEGAAPQPSTRHQEP